MSQALQCINNQSLTVGNLASYVHWVQQLPMLTEQEEQELAQALYNHGDIEAARKLVMSHLRFVVKVARGYNGYGLAQEDLIQEGNIGLMKAVKRFNPMVGVRLVSFAVYWIRAEIHEFVIRNWRIVKIATTKAQRKLFFKLRQACKSIGSSLNTQLSEHETNIIAEELNVSTDNVTEMQQRLSSFDQSYEAHDGESSGSQNYLTSNAPAYYLEDKSYSPERLVEESDWVDNQETGLYAAIDQLDSRSQAIIKQRWLNHDDKKSTLHELAAEYNISAERVRQLEKQAMQKLQSLVAENGAAA